MLTHKIVHHLEIFNKKHEKNIEIRANSWPFGSLKDPEPAVELPTIHHAGKAVAQTSAGVFRAALLVAALGWKINLGKLFTENHRKSMVFTMKLPLKYRVWKGVTIFPIFSHLILWKPQLIHKVVCNQQFLVGQVGPGQSSHLVPISSHRLLLLGGSQGEFHSRLQHCMYDHPHQNLLRKHSQMCKNHQFNYWYLDYNKMEPE